MERVAKVNGTRDPTVAQPCHSVSSPIMIALLSKWVTGAMSAPTKSSAAALFHGICTACCADGHIVMQFETAVVPIAHRNRRDNHDFKKSLVVNVVGVCVDMTNMSKASPLLKRKRGGPDLPVTNSNY